MSLANDSKPFKINPFILSLFNPKISVANKCTFIVSLTLSQHLTKISSYSYYKNTVGIT